MNLEKAAKEYKEFMIWDGCTATPRVVQRRGLPIAYAENVHVIEYSAFEEIERSLIAKDQRIAELENYLTVIKYGMRGSSVMTRTQMIEVASKALKSPEAKHE